MENKTIDQFSDEELVDEIRKTQNQDVGRSLYRRAQTEWNIRQQRKLLNDQNEYNRKILKANRNLVIVSAALAIVTLLAAAAQTNFSQSQLSDSQKSGSSKLMFSLTQQIRTGASSDLIYAIASDETPLLRKNGGKFSDEQLDNYLVEYELLDQAYEQGLISKDMLSTAFRYDIEAAYQNKEIMTFINQVRQDNNDNTIYQGFINLAILFKK